MFNLFNKSRQPPPKKFPPVPAWKPRERQSMERVVDQMQYYTNGKKDFAVFENGSIAILPDGLSDSDAVSHAKTALHQVFYAHPDMHPLHMDDGNILIRYNHDMVSIVLEDHAKTHWKVIDANHQNALATDEVLVTPLGPNKFDDFGKKALFGRCFLFMDAQEPKVIQIVRHVV